MEKLSRVGSGSGAPMGRRDRMGDTDLPVEFEVQRLFLVDGAYDEGGAYWGSGLGETSIYRFAGESEVGTEEMFVRAATLAEAERQVRARYPRAAFSDECDVEEVFGGYMEAALFSTYNDRHSTDPDNEEEMLDDAGYSVAEETRSHLRENCRRFLSTARPLLERAASTAAGYDLAQAGRDFWFDSNHHGVGVRDRGLPDELAKAIEAVSTSFPEEGLYVGDDDLVRSEREHASARPSNPSP